MSIRETGVEAAKIGGFLALTANRQQFDAVRDVDAKRI